MQTSIIAFESIQPHLNELQKIVYNTISKHEGVTDNEITEITTLNPNTSRPRRIELYKKGLIHVMGYKTQRNGRKAAMWRISTW